MKKISLETGGKIKWKIAGFVETRNSTLFSGKWLFLTKTKRTTLFHGNKAT